jgi:hypothetical protein
LFFYACETWSLTLREECRLRFSENRVLRRIFWPKRDEVPGEWRRLHNEDFMLSTPHQISFRKSNQGDWDGQGMWHVCRRREVHIVFWWKNMKEKRHFEDTNIDARIILKLKSEKWTGGMD